jgi:hypothetical protein
MLTSTTRRLGASLLLGMLAVGVTACGGTTVAASNFKGESHAVAQRISDFQSDATAVDEQKMCDNDLASTIVARLKAAGSNCEKALKTQLAQVDKFNLSVDSVKVTGDTATAQVKSIYSNREHPSTLQLVKEGHNWKIAGIN